jgi:predicted small lipoprotein YifL
MNRSACIAALCASLAGCGGGGNESGPPDALLASPTAVTVSGAPGSQTCYTGTGPTVFVYGGQPPYKLSNSAPPAMTLDKAVLNNSGDGVVITFINGVCLSTIPITVEDAMGRVLSIGVSNTPG